MANIIVLNIFRSNEEEREEKIVNILIEEINRKAR